MSAQRSLSLWEIKSEYQSLVSQLYDYETGEINVEVDAQLSALSGSAETKCIALSQWITNLEAEKKQIEYMKDQVLLREAAYNREISKRLNYLEDNMKSMGLKEIKCPYFTLRIKANPYSTEITDQSALPERFIKRTEKVVVTESPDKNAIKEEVLKTGAQIPGANVYQKTKLEISITKL